MKTNSTVSFPTDLRSRPAGAVMLLRLWICSAAVAGLLTAEPPQVSGVLNPQKSAIRLELRGTIGVDYAIEASSDLNVWQPITNGQPNGGVLFSEQPLLNHYRFFRGREGGSTNGTVPLSVTPLADTNLAVSFLVTADGGSAVVYSPDGAQFTFTVPPLAVLDAEVITMTVVTNIGDLPFSQGILGALRLEPDRLALWDAAMLEISVPDGLDLRKIVSFTAHGNGSAFHLTPDRVTTNSVLIPVTELGLFGSALALDTEVQSAASASAFIARSDTFRVLQAACPPESPNAQFFDAQLGQLAQRYSQGVASSLIQSRRGQPRGVPGDTFPAEQAVRQVENASCDVITRAMDVRLNDGAADCAIGKVLLRHVAWLRGVRRFLNIPDGFGCPALQSWDYCGLLKNCVKEIKACCDGGVRGPQQFAAITEIVRLGQSIQPSCLFTTEIHAAEDACTPGRWTGTLSLNIIGRDSRRIDAVPGQIVTELDTKSEGFHGRIVDSTEFASSQGTNVTLIVEGQAIYTKDRTRGLTTEGVCGGSFTFDDDKNYAHGPAAYTVLLTMNPGQPAFVVITPHLNDNPILPGRRSTYHYSRIGARGTDGRCSQKVESNGDIKDSQSVITGALFGKEATFQNNQLSGGADMDAIQMELPGTGRFEWRFTRHPERP